MIYVQIGFGDEVDLAGVREAVRALTVTSVIHNEEVVFEDDAKLNLGSLYVKFMGPAAVKLLRVRKEDEVLNPRVAVRLGAAIRNSDPSDTTIDVWSTLSSTKMRAKHPVIVLNDGSTHTLSQTDPAFCWATDLVYFSLFELIFP